MIGLYTFFGLSLFLYASERWAVRWERRVIRQERREALEALGTLEAEERFFRERPEPSPSHPAAWTEFRVPLQPHV